MSSFRFQQGQVQQERDVLRRHPAGQRPDQLGQRLRLQQHENEEA